MENISCRKVSLTVPDTETSQGLQTGKGRHSYGTLFVVFVVSFEKETEIMKDFTDVLPRKFLSSSSHPDLPLSEKRLETPSSVTTFGLVECWNSWSK